MLGFFLVEFERILFYFSEARGEFTTVWICRMGLVWRVEVIRRVIGREIELFSLGEYKCFFFVFEYEIFLCMFVFVSLNIYFNYCS